MSVSSIPPNQSNVLLAVYKRHVEENLYNNLMQELTPKVRKAAKDAVAALEMEIRSEYQKDSERMVIELKVKGLDNAK